MTHKHLVAGPARAGRTVLALAAVAAVGVFAPAAASAAGSKSPEKPAPEKATTMPIEAKVLSPQAGSSQGAGAALFTVDVSLEATKKSFNKMLAPSAGYFPVFSNPLAPTFKPGPDPGAAGLVVLMSTTATTAGTPFQGPSTNLAGLFQINNVIKNKEGKLATSNVWQAGKPLFGSGPTELTVFAVSGAAPAILTPGSYTRISNVVKVPFNINP
jgi:hypothetical protein